MDEIMTWSVTIDISEHDGHTKALARLHTRRHAAADRRRFRPPRTHRPRRAGDRCRTRHSARLADLGQDLVALATEDVEAVNRQPHLVQ